MLRFLAFAVLPVLILSQPATFTFAQTKETSITLKAVGHVGKTPTAKEMQSTIEIMKERLKNAKIAGVGFKQVGKDAIKVTVPTTDAKIVKRISSLLTRPGTIEFAILANENDHVRVIKKVAALKDKRDHFERERLVAGWRDVGVDANGKPLEIGEHGGVVIRKVGPRKKRRVEFLIYFEPRKERINQTHLEKIQPAVDAQGKPALSFQFNKSGATRMAKLTGANLPASDSGFKRRLAILVDDRIIMAPAIIGQIAGEGMIYGKFTQEEIMNTVAVLKVRKALPVKVQIVDDKSEADKGK